ncbi:hypothetical protein J2X31_003623 [Flavobacterium arsenatis]|uniref:Sugar-binding protein n=1 Tax=Flavobacterium arsenatis TaxID=1484332 RepID=A0ABU1TUN1_9FLAO|nr:hypothetical protein [Flavobacterium arsenatis]MDR6969590.1 hypothetical protein [Flavobacterium arsenatis]
MKNPLILLIFAFSIFGNANAQQTTENTKPKNRTDYQKISSQEISYFFSKETPKHKLASVTKYGYDTIQNWQKETGYEVQNGKLAFHNEYVYQYDEKDTLVYESQYSEIPSAEYPAYLLNNYLYNFQDSLTLEVRSFDGLVQDSIFTRYGRDEKNRIISEIEIQKSIYKGEKYTRKTNETYYNYDNQNNIIAKAELENFETATNETTYEYDKNNTLRKSIYTNHRMGYTATNTYDTNGKLILKEEKIGDEKHGIRRYKYNKKGLEIEESKFSDNKLMYRYSTTYDAKNRKIKYEMTEIMEDKSSSINLYEYDNDDKLKYIIYLNWRKEKPVQKVEIMEVAPAKQN